jgi:putative transposase
MEPLRAPTTKASGLFGFCAETGAVTATAVVTQPGKHHHRWKAREGEKRTIVVRYQPSDAILRFLRDMRDALTETLAHACALAKSNGNVVPNPIALRRKVKPWFDSEYGDYAKHHVNPVCRTAVALLRSYRKRHWRLAVPQVRRLAMRIDSELFRVTVNSSDGTVTVRVTLMPFNYGYITFTPTHKKWSEYSSGKASELLLTDRKLCITFNTRFGQDGEKPLGARMAGSDLNFRSVDSTPLSSGGKLEPPITEPLNRIVQIQNDFSRRRRRLQLHIENPKKRARKLAETKGRQRNKIEDELHKLSTRVVQENPDTSFIFENLKNIRRNGEKKRKTASRKLRTYLNRWPYRMFQKMVDYKSRCRTLYVSPRGTSSECPVCGGELEHPAWAVSRCVTCGADYDRDRLASLAILLRGLRLCGRPFAVSAGASWQPMRNEYLYASREAKAGGTGWTKQATNAPNRNEDNFHVFPRF